MLWHAVSHAMQDETAGFRLRYYLDAAVVLASGRAIHWETITERMCGPEIPDRELAAVWLLGAAELAGAARKEIERATPPGPGARLLSPGSPVPLMLAWRLAVFGGWPRASRWREKLLDEGARAQLGMPQARLASSRSVLVAARRRAATLAARGVYHLWRAARP